jgi:hypothetical protein
VKRDKRLVGISAIPEKDSPTPVVNPEALRYHPRLKI